MRRQKGSDRTYWPVVYSVKPPGLSLLPANRYFVFVWRDSISTRVELVRIEVEHNTPEPQRPNSWYVDEFPIFYSKQQLTSSSLVLFSPLLAFPLPPVGCSGTEAVFFFLETTLVKNAAVWSNSSTSEALSLDLKQEEKSIFHLRSLAHIRLLPQREGFSSERTRNLLFLGFFLLAFSSSILFCMRIILLQRRGFRV